MSDGTADMTLPRWRFARMTPAEINQDPVQGEFFSREADLPGRLVRESIQNSLDARRGREPVRVRFVFSGESNALSPKRAAPYLKGLKKHVKAVVDAGGMLPSAEDDEEQGAAHDALACFKEPMTYLVIEDFGTKGLTGDIGANSEREQGNDFWGFFRSIGISPKSENDAGSWGLGKWVFPDASTINSYLGMTQRIGEDSWLLMGMSLLKTHSLAGGKYRYYGSFAAHDGVDDDRWFPRPVSSDYDPDDFILQALADFRLDRMDDPGLSVIVPYPRLELTPDTVARAVLTQYFLAVVRGALVVEIIHVEDGRRLIDAGSITNEVRKIAASDRDDESAESLERAIDLARWSLDQEPGAHSELPALDLANALRDSADIGEIRERYEHGERLAFRLTMDVRPRERATAHTDYRLYLERDDELEKGHDYFMRGSLRIPRMDHIKAQNARALVLVGDDSELGHMLRDAEGPAHESWDPHAPRLKEAWIGGQTRVRAVRRSAVELLQGLHKRHIERQLDALADLFPGDPGQIDGGPRSKPGGPTPGLPTPLSAPSSPLRVESPAGAFVVKAAAQAARDDVVGRGWNVRFAYDTVRGNPFSAFSPADFSLEVDGDLRLDHERCRIDVLGPNTLRFVASDEQFLLRVSGFDERDVKVEVLPDAGPEVAEAQA